MATISARLYVMLLNLPGAGSATSQPLRIERKKPDPGSGSCVRGLEGHTVHTHRSSPRDDTLNTACVMRMRRICNSSWRFSLRTHMCGVLLKAKEWPRWLRGGGNVFVLVTLVCTHRSHPALCPRTLLQTSIDASQSRQALHWLLQSQRSETMTSLVE